METAADFPSMPSSSIGTLLCKKTRRNHMSLYEVIGLFCQITLLLIFTFSFVQKLRNHIAYEHSVEGFAILPKRWVTPLAWFATGAESLVAALLLGGLLWNGMRIAGALLALVVLLIFTGALISVVARRLHISCGCFGADEHPVSAATLARNVGLIVCCVITALPTFAIVSVIRYPFLALLLIALAAATFVLLWSFLDEITVVLRPKTV
jgi:hypothetical protein